MFGLVVGFRGGVSACVQSQDAAPGVGRTTPGSPALGPSPDPVITATASTAAAADASGCRTGKRPKYRCQTLHYRLEIKLVTNVKYETEEYFLQSHPV